MFFCLITPEAKVLYLTSSPKKRPASPAGRFLLFQPALRRFIHIVGQFRASHVGHRVGHGVVLRFDDTEALAEAVRTRQWRGAGNQPITDVVSIGIGGSHLP